MADNPLDIKDIIAQMSERFVETAQEKLARLNDILNQLGRSREDEQVLMEEFRREVHSLKGMGGTFQMPLVTRLCHKFEDFLTHEEPGASNLIEDCFIYLDRLNDLIDSAQAGDESKADIWLANLPEKSKKAAETRQDAENKVLLITNDQSLIDEIAPLFEMNGFSVTHASSAFRGYKAAVLQNPDIVLVAQCQDEMDGAELVRSLAALQGLSTATFAMICPDRHAALSEKLQGVQLLSQDNVAIDVMNFIALVVTT